MRIAHFTATPPDMFPTYSQPSDRCRLPYPLSARRAERERSAQHLVGKRAEIYPSKPLRNNVLIADAPVPATPSKLIHVHSMILVADGDSIGLVYGALVPESED